MFGMLFHILCGSVSPTNPEFAKSVSLVSQFALVIPCLSILRLEVISGLPDPLNIYMGS